MVEIGDKSFNIENSFESLQCNNNTDVCNVFW